MGFISNTFGLRFAVSAALVMAVMTACSTNYGRLQYNNEVSLAFQKFEKLDNYRLLLTAADEQALGDHRYRSGVRIQFTLLEPSSSPISSKRWSGACRLPNTGFSTVLTC